MSVDYLWTIILSYISSTVTIGQRSWWVDWVSHRFSLVFTYLNCLFSVRLSLILIQLGVNDMRCSGVVVEYRTRNGEVAGLTHTRSTASSLEQVANLLCAQVNSASYSQRDVKWVVATATGWRPSVADWGDGVSASCTVGPVVHKCGQWMATDQFLK